jgi:ABC-type phosphate transport system substrate-binding protein
MPSRAREASRFCRATDPARRGERSRLAVAIGVLWALACVAAGADAPAAGGISVVANRSVSADALSLATLRSVFLIRTSEWPDGTRITVFVLPDRDESHVAFCTKLLKTFPYVLRDIWDRAVFTGTGKAPIEVANEQELLRRVAATRGAIGYFQSAKVTDEKIKLLQIR